MKLVGLTYWLFLLPKYRKWTHLGHGKNRKWTHLGVCFFRKWTHLGVQIETLYYRDLIFIK